jgi:hypothetical protein
MQRDESQSSQQSSKTNARQHDEYNEAARRMQLNSMKAARRMQLNESTMTKAARRKAARRMQLKLAKAAQRKRHDKIGITKAA